MSSNKKPSGWGPLGAGQQRLNKVLAAAGLGSRRACDEFISEGRVEVNGEVANQLGLKVDPSTDQIRVDGEPLKRFKPVYYAVNKPVGIVSTNSDPEGRPRVIDLVPDRERLFSVGRLDRSSEGLMLLTNDGELAQRLAHPKFQISKTYHVTVQGQIDVAHLARLERGIHLAEGFARVDRVKIRKQRKHATDLEIELSEGKNREIRRILARLGHKVVELKRVAIGPLKLGDIPTGSYRPLTSEEVRKLYEDAENQRKKKKVSRPGKGGASKSVVAPGPIDDDVELDEIAEELEAERMLESPDLGVVIDYSGEAVGEMEYVPGEDENWDEDGFPEVVIDEDGDEIILPPQPRGGRGGKPRGEGARGADARAESKPRGRRSEKGLEGSGRGARSEGFRGRGTGERGSRERGSGERGFGERSNRERGGRDGGGRPSSDRRSSEGGFGRSRGPGGGRPPRGDRSEGGSRGFSRRGDGEDRGRGERGERDRGGERGFGDRRPGPRGTGPRGPGSRGPGSSGERPDRRREGGFSDRGPGRDRDSGERGPRSRGFGERSFGQRGSGERGGDGPSRGGRPGGSRGGERRSFGDGPRGDRPRGDGPRSDRPRGDGPRSDRPRSDRGYGDRAYGDRGDRGGGSGGSRGGRPGGGGGRPSAGGFRGGRSGGRPGGGGGPRGSGGPRGGGSGRPRGGGGRGRD